MSNNYSFLVHVGRLFVPETFCARLWKLSEGRVGSSAFKAC